MVVLPIPFWFGYVLYLFLAWFLWLELPILCSIRVFRVDIFSLFLNFLRRLSTFYLWLLWWHWFCHKWLLLCWGMVPLYQLWWECIFFITVNGCWILSTAFSTCTEKIVFFCLFVCFFFPLFNVYITLTDFCLLNHPWDTGLNLTWSWCMMPFFFFLFFNLNSLLDSVFYSVCCILMRIFVFIFIKDIGLQLSFLQCFFFFDLVFILAWWWSHRMNLGDFLSLP